MSFRNYASLSLALSPGTNIFYGSNAQGKTNILEAIYLAGTTKSHRLSKDRDLIRMGDEESHIRMLIDRNGNEYRIDMHLKKNRPKGVAVGGVPVRRAADLYGIASLVFFSPEDLNIIKNGPAGRRRYLDLVLSAVDRIYLADLVRYGKILAQRNALLHDAALRPERAAELDVWDGELVSTGGRSIKRREAFVKQLGDMASGKHLLLTEEKERLRISYEPNTEADQLADKTARNRDMDLRTKETHAGPHRDDLCVRVNGMDLRLYGSQGQQRTAALSMKMAEIAVIESIRKDKPVLLLDDVLSELDAERRNALLKSIRDTQTLITCTGYDEFVRDTFHADSIFHVENGSVKKRHFSGQEDGRGKKA